LPGGIINARCCSGKYSLLPTVKKRDLLTSLQGCNYGVCEITCIHCCGWILIRAAWLLVAVKGIKTLCRKTQLTVFADNYTFIRRISGHCLAGNNLIIYGVTTELARGKTGVTAGFLLIMGSSQTARKSRHKYKQFKTGG
jgi:hypothetical protein